jgi:4-hydroxy-3-polyprenylbenzoate decarboxylase
MGWHFDMTIVVGITGASGALIAAKTVNELLDRNIPTSVVASNPAKLVWKQEMGETFGEALEQWSNSKSFTNYAIGDFNAPIASGSFPSQGMVVVPSSMATISAIANGSSDNLIRRSADVCIKEKRPLIIIPRESPLSRIHLSNMERIAELGGTIITADPPFYLPISTISDSAEFTANKILVALGVEKELPLHMQYNGPQV